ncbi:MAG: TrmB family transcriptional regulator [Candidatus Diapherotrites archaeon]|nr:TrmB family transcriptional regulator [Candidatus Diapherotrites archaeon]
MKGAEFLRKLIDLSKGLGLNEYESKAYLALLQLGEAPVAVISEKAGIPRARVYDVLVSLQKKGFVAQKLVKPVQYTALSLKSALNSVKEKKKSEMNSHFNELDSIINSIESQLQIASTEASTESAVLLSGRKNIFSAVSTELGLQEQIFVAPKESIDSFKKHFSNKHASMKLKESNKSKFMVLSDDSVLLYLNHPENEEEEKALLIKSNFLANHFNSMIKK